MDGKNLEMATLGGGCFWCLEAVFERVVGVEGVVSGYAGGWTENPDYRHVCSGNTGHAEVVQITFDPDLVAYEQLLEVFFAIHDPTTPDRQGADVGTQYRSVVICHSETQRQIAAGTLRRLVAERRWDDPVVTELLPDTRFYPAEAYHQHYFARNPDQGYCQVVVAPKIGMLRKAFVHLIGRNQKPAQA